MVLPRKITPPFAVGDAVAWGGVNTPLRRGTVSTVLPDALVELIEDVTGRTWRLPAGQVMRT